MLKLVDGRSELWQWDTKRKIEVEPDCDQLHFSNKLLGRSLDVDVIGGIAIIPDELLQTDKDITVWGYVGSADEGYTKFSKTFKVNRKNKPSDYVYTPHEIYTIDQAVQKALQEAKDSGEFDGKDGKDGKDGQNGKDGADGKTPVNGVDYNTPEEKEELKNEILTATRDEWIDLADITTEEDVSYITFDKDVNGNPFSVKKVVVLVKLPAQLLQQGVYISTGMKQWNGASLGVNIALDARFIHGSIEVMDGKYTELKIAQTKIKNFSSNYAFTNIISEDCSLISAFYFGGAYSSAMNNHIPAGTTLKVWGVKA